MGVASLDKPAAQPEIPVEELIIEDKGVGKFVTMNRPRVLNCINLSMLRGIAGNYERWEQDETVGFIVLKGAGRVFCAGGDLRMFYALGKHDDGWRVMVYTKYWLDYHIATFKKPLVALWHGLVMGGGAGLTVAGTFGVATEKTVFAMPEAALGLQPDCGSSYWLSRLSGSFGEFMALTGHRLDGAEMFACGIASHFVPTESLAELEMRLAELPTGDEAEIRRVIESFHKPPAIPATSALHKREAIDRIFSKDTIEEIMQALEDELEATQESWVKETLKVLKRSSPTSLRVTLQLIRTARNSSRADCLKMDFRLTINALKGTVTDDFYEGIRAIVVDKDNAPKWNPKTTLEVTQENVDLLFKPFPDADELLLPLDGQPRWTGKFVEA